MAELNKIAFSYNNHHRKGMSVVSSLTNFFGQIMSNGKNVILQIL
jgi:hypothetical protein